MGFLGFFKRKKKVDVCSQRPLPPALLPRPTQADIEKIVNHELSSLPSISSRTINVAGVTFKNGRRSRQTILKQIYWKDSPYNTIDYEDFLSLNTTEYEGEPAIEVWVRSKKDTELIGYIPKNDVAFFIHNFDRIVRYENFSVSGGGTAPNGEPISYGASFTVFFKNAENTDGTPVAPDESYLYARRIASETLARYSLDDRYDLEMAKLNAEYCFAVFCYDYPAYCNATYEVDTLIADAYHTTINIFFLGKKLCSVRYDRKDNDVYCYDENHRPFRS